MCLRDSCTTIQVLGLDGIVTRRQTRKIATGLIRATVNIKCKTGTSAGRSTDTAIGSSGRGGVGCGTRYRYSDTGTGIGCSESKTITACTAIRVFC